MTATIQDGLQRHGTRRAYVKFDCRCDSCRCWAILTYGKNGEYNNLQRVRRRTEQRWENQHRLMDAEPYRTLILALRAQHVSVVRMMELTTLSRTCFDLIVSGATQWIYPDTAEKLRRLLDLLPSEASA